MGTAISKNDLSFSGHCTVNNQTATNFKGSGHSNLNSIVCTNLLQSSGHTKIEASMLNQVRVSGWTKFFQSTANEISSSGHLKISDCPKIGTVKASGHTTLDHCQEVGDIAASGGFSLNDSKVTGNVTLSGKETAIIDSTISGTLECAEKIIKIRNSTIGRVVVKPVKYSSTRYSFELEIFPNWKTPISYKSYGPVTESQEQIVELSGKNCRVGSITFEEGVIGRVVLKDGATLPV